MTDQLFEFVATHTRGDIVHGYAVTLTNLDGLDSRGGWSVRLASAHLAGLGGRPIVRAVIAGTLYHAATLEIAKMIARKKVRINGARRQKQAGVVPVEIVFKVIA